MNLQQQDNIFKYETGVIHGRFQVLHKDHLKYILAGKSLCRHIVVGITNPDPVLTRSEAADPGRSHPLENPLTYYERYVLLNAALPEAGLERQDFSVVPLPVNLPELYQYYVPLDAVFFLTIYDDWGRQKLRYFESLGLTAHVLWETPPEKKRHQRGRHPKANGRRRIMGNNGARECVCASQEMGHSREIKKIR